MRRLSPENAQGEYYLTDVVEVLAGAGYLVAALAVADAAETQGVNDRLQLATAEAELRRRTNEAWMRRGVTMVDPDTDLRRRHGRARPRRHPVPGDDAPGPVPCRLRLRRSVRTPASSTAWSERGASSSTPWDATPTIGDGAIVGPFAALEPGSRVPDGARTGPFYTAGPADSAG